MSVLIFHTYPSTYNHNADENCDILKSAYKKIFNVKKQRVNQKCFNFMVNNFLYSTTKMSQFLCGL